MADDRNYLSSSSLYHLPLITCLTGKYCQDIGWAYKLLGKPQGVLLLAIFILCLVALFNILEKICCSVRFLVSSCILMIKPSIISNLKTVFHYSWTSYLKYFICVRTFSQIWKVVSVLFRYTKGEALKSCHLSNGNSLNLGKYNFPLEISKTEKLKNLFFLKSMSRTRFSPQTANGTNYFLRHP